MNPARAARRAASAVRRRLRALSVPHLRPVRLTAMGTIFARIARQLALSARSGARKKVRQLLRKEAPLRVGVDIRPFYEPLTGIGWYLFHLLEELARDHDLELVYFGDAFVTEDGPSLHVSPPPGRPVIFDLRSAGVGPAGAALARMSFPLAIWLEGCDVHFGGNYFLPRPMGAVARRRVITVHDLTFRRYPDLLQRETLAALDREMGREIFRTDAVICVSEATRRDLHSYYSLSEARSVTIHSGLAPMTGGKEGHPLPPHYLLFVGTIEPRKDLDTLIEAFDALKTSGRYNGALVVVGRIGWKSQTTVEKMRASVWSTDIHHLNYVSRDALSAIYQAATLFVFPSLYEGFGFPLLEAMASGVPTIAADSSSLPEIGGDATLYFEPGNATALAAAIEKVTGDPELRRSLIVRGRARAAGFEWTRTAQATASLFHRVAER